MTTRPRVDLAWSFRTALSLPPPRHLGSRAAASGGLTLTPREEVLLQAATRRSLRAMAGLAGFTVACLASLNAAGMSVLFPHHRADVLLINGIEILVALGLTALVLGPARQRPLPVAFAIAFSTVVTVLYLLLLVPESRTTSFMLLALLPPSVALFLPWGRTSQVAWLLAGGAALAVFTMSPAGTGVPTSDWAGAWLILVIAGLASLGGQAGAEHARRAGFLRQVQLIRSSVDGRAREGELQRLSTALAQAARTDPLTGLGNRLRLNDELVAMAARSMRYGHGCAVVLLDLDRFKGYNDSLGHLAGDAALQAVARVLQATARAADVVCRYGGEEFIVLMPEQTIEGAARAAERFRDAVERLQLRRGTPTGHHVLTISAGVAMLGERVAHDAEDALRAADAALYNAKRAGRNRVEIAPQEP